MNIADEAQRIDRSLVARLFRMRDNHEEIEIAVWTGAAPGIGTEEIDVLGIKAVCQAPGDGVRFRWDAACPIVVRRSDVCGPDFLYLIRRVMDSRWQAPRSILFSLEKEAAHDQNVHLRPEEASERFFGAADDRLVFVKGSVQKQRDGSKKIEGRNELVKERVNLAVDASQTSSTASICWSSTASSSRSKK